MLEAPVWFFPDFVVTDRRHSAAYLVFCFFGGVGNFLGNFVFSYRVAVGIARIQGFVFSFFLFLGGLVFAWEKLAEFCFCLTVFVCVCFCGFKNSI